MRIHLPLPALFALLLAGCADDRLPTAPPAAAPGEAHVRAVLECTAAVRESVLRCGDTTAPAGIHPVILGGQGTYVRLENTGTSWTPATGTFQTNVTVQNLVAQPLGTPDGATATGIRVFFSSLPAATQGTGAVEVENPDGTGIFTAAAQPYFRFAQIAWPGQTTAARTWRFGVDPGVEAFSFRVLVEARIPAEGGVLRWTARTPCDGCTVHALSAFGGVVFGASTTQTVQAPNSMRIVRSEDGGVRWTETLWPAPPLSPGCENPDAPYVQMGSVWPVDDQVVYAAYYRVHATCNGDEQDVFDRGGVLRSTDGGRTWPAELAPNDRWESLMPRSMWGSSATDVYIAGTFGWGTRGRILHTTDGFQTYTVHDAGNDLLAVWGSGPDDVYAAGSVNYWMDVIAEDWPLCRPEAPDNPAAGVTGLVLHSGDGGATWQETRFPGLVLTGVWGTQDGRVWAVGAFGQGSYSSYRWCAAVLQSADGGRTWNQQVMPSVYPLTGVWGSGPDAVYAAGRHGTVLVFNGRTWTRMGGFAGADLWAVTGTGPHDVVAAGRGALQGTR